MRVFSSTGVELILENASSVSSTRVSGGCADISSTRVEEISQADGYPYERSAVELWFKTHDTSPMTNETLPCKLLFTNRVLKSLITAFRASVRVEE